MANSADHYCGQNMQDIKEKGYSTCLKFPSALPLHKHFKFVEIWVTTCKNCDRLVSTLAGVGLQRILLEFQVNFI